MMYKLLLNYLVIMYTSQIVLVYKMNSHICFILAHSTIIKFCFHNINARAKSVSFKYWMISAMNDKQLIQHQNRCIASTKMSTHERTHRGTRKYTQAYRMGCVSCACVSFFRTLKTDAI